MNEDVGIVRANPKQHTTNNQYSKKYDSFNPKSKESGGIKAIKNTIKLKSKQFSVKRSIIEKSFNALEMINQWIKNREFHDTVGLNYWDPISNKTSLSWKLGINIPVYHLSDKKKATKFMYTPLNYSSKQFQLHI